MIDLKLIRENPDLVKKAVRDKNMPCDIDHLLAVDARRRALETEWNELRYQQNQAGERIAKASKEQKAALSQEMAPIRARLKEIDAEREKEDAELRELLLLVPQIPDPAAPVGRDASGNVEVRRVGTPKQTADFGFEFRDHLELGTGLDIIDTDRGVKIAGARNYVLKGAGTLLHEAVLRLAWDVMLAKRYVSDEGTKARRHEGTELRSTEEGERRRPAGTQGRSEQPQSKILPARRDPKFNIETELRFVPLTVPVLVSDKLMYGTGFFPLHREEVYLCERDAQSLVGTAEVPVTGYHMDEILAEAELPKLYFARSTCFRREAGAAGKDTRGLFRIHFFDKIEQVVVCKADPAESAKWHEAIIANAEAVLQALGLPYRVMEVCTGDMGQGKVRMFDIETWMPGRGDYGETHSASRFHDFQARRLNLRYRRADSGKPEFCHTLNNTVIASPRILIPLLELNQNADGSVTIPPALRKYMDGMERIGP